MRWNKKAYAECAFLFHLWFLCDIPVLHVIFTENIYRHNISS